MWSNSFQQSYWDHWPVFLTGGSGKPEYAFAKQDPFLILCENMNPEYTKDLNVKLKLVNSYDKTHGEKFHGIEFGDVFRIWHQKNRR